MLCYSTNISNTVLYTNIRILLGVTCTVVCYTQSARAGSQKGLDSWLSTAITPTITSSSSAATNAFKVQQSNGTVAAAAAAAAPAAVTNGSSSGAAASPAAAAVPAPAAVVALAAAAPDVDPCVNTAICCPHGKLTPNRKLWRLISASAWRRIVAVYGDTVLEFNPAEGACPTCEVNVSTATASIVLDILICEVNVSTATASIVSPILSLLIVLTALLYLK
jgi:hypothetical protein